MQVFVSYRRSDASGYAGRLHDSLVQRLGAANVFQDVAGIDPGIDFMTALDEALDRCDAVLAVIGPSWLTAARLDGTPRLHEEGDYVRLELAHALARGARVVPVLVGGAILPTAGELPEDLGPVTSRQAFEIRDESWHRDVLGLLAALEGERDGPTDPRRRQRIVAAAAVVAAIATAGAFALPGAGDGSGDGEEEYVPPPACEPTTGADWRDLEGVDGGTVTTTDQEAFTFGVVDGRWREVEPGQWRLLVRTTTRNGSDGDAYNGEWLWGSAVVGSRAADRMCFTADPELLLAGTEGTAVVGYDTPCRPEGYIELVVGPQNARLPVTSTDLPASCEPLG